MRSAKALSKYFFGALFVRPYTPGFIAEVNFVCLYFQGKLEKLVFLG